MKPALTEYQQAVLDYLRGHGNLPDLQIKYGVNKRDLDRAISILKKFNYLLK